MLSDLIHPPKCSNYSNCSSSKTLETGKKAPKKGGFNHPATATPATPATPEMPSHPQLDRICRRAVADYPDVPADRLLAFLVEAEDPHWCTEKVARHLARRMSEGLIHE